ncbi:MAG: hypothetical protein IJB69_09645, partial [Clostridia bacterium]|nr:hypothetical protein [Clostridia bacterium]
VNVTDGTNVYVRLIAYKFFLCHWDSLLFRITVIDAGLSAGLYLRKPASMPVAFHACPMQACKWSG